MVYPASRSTDPETSHKAERQITSSGKRQTLTAICREAIQNYPGRTAGEIGEITGLGHERVWRRISDLKNDGHVVAGKPRRWKTRDQRTWFIAPDAPGAPQRHCCDMGAWLERHGTDRDLYDHRHRLNH